MNSSELERAEDAECEAQRAAAGRRRAEEAVGRLEAREAVGGAHSAGEWIARWEQLSPGQRFELAERIIADDARLARVREYHSPRATQSWFGGGPLPDQCLPCDETWPCLTIDVMEGRE